MSHIHWVAEVTAEKVEVVGAEKVEVMEVTATDQARYAQVATE